MFDAIINLTTTLYSVTTIEIGDYNPFCYILFLSGIASSITPMQRSFIGVNGALGSLCLTLMDTSLMPRSQCQSAVHSLKASL